MHVVGKKKPGYPKSLSWTVLWFLRFFRTQNHIPGVRLGFQCQRSKNET